MPTPRCNACPAAPDHPCRGGVFCEWAGAETPDPVHLRHIVAVSLRDVDRPLPVDPGVVPCHDPTPARPLIPLAGDLVAALTQKIGVDRLAKWVANKVGKEDCGCVDRQMKLNALDAAARKFLGMRS